MIDHVEIPVSDLAASRAFYEKAFEPLGFKVKFGQEGKFWAFDLKGHGLFEIFQTKGLVAKIHIAFRVPSREFVQQFYEAAMAAGAVNNGLPGPRPHYSPNYYACFVLDPDGHNIEAVHDDWLVGRPE